MRWRGLGCRRGRSLSRAQCGRRGRACSRSEGCSTSSADQDARRLTGCGQLRSPVLVGPRASTTSRVDRLLVSQHATAATLCRSRVPIETHAAGRTAWRDQRYWCRVAYEPAVGMALSVLGAIGLRRSPGCLQNVLARPITKRQDGPVGIVYGLWLYQRLSPSRCQEPAIEMGHRCRPTHDLCSVRGSVASSNRVPRCPIPAVR